LQGNPAGGELMKIDRDTKTPMETGESVQPDSQTTPRTSGNERLAHKQEDRLSNPVRGLSPDCLPDETEAKMLAAKVNQLPETRSEKVASIASAIQKGDYRVSPEQTAEAIISEMESRAELDGVANKGRDNMSAPNGMRIGPSTLVAEPLTLYSQRTPSSKRRRRKAPPALRDDEFREDSEPSRDLMDSSG
jgi:anti-sigma28 factor (negative regulator of flagellin synthesis)